MLKLSLLNEYDVEKKPRVATLSIKKEEIFF